MRKKVRKAKREHPWIASGISLWFVMQTLIIIGVGILTTIFVDRIAVTFAEIEGYRTIRIISIIATLAVLLIIFEFLQYRMIKRNLEKIYLVISDLAKGQYGKKLKIGRFTVFKGLYRDINQLSEELEKVHMLRNDFVNTYSHEFKTPIASINGFAQLLYDDDTLPRETQKQYLKIIADESERLTALASNTILLAQLESQKIVDNKKPYSLDEQLRSCVILLSKAWGEKELDIQGDFSDITINGNEDMLHAVWVNLLYNAIKFTPSGGKIFISAKQTERLVTVEIADTGCGMNKETAENIFKKYFQAKTPAAQKGLGLGLPIAKQIINLHGGKISVKSELNKGTTFTVTLPI